jgi:putative transposase
MPRIARVVAVGYPHHITHRGNYKQIIFEEENDFIQYSKIIKKYSEKYLLSILTYCLMPNHVHFIALPEVKESLAKTFNVSQMVYAQYMNNKREITGHLWQGRFYSCVLDELHLYAAIRYVERNPVRAGLVKNPCDWKWSSAREHVMGEKGIIPLMDISNLVKINNWEEFLRIEDEEEFLDEIRKHTNTGRPLGDKTFLRKLEKIFKKKLTPQSIGRPRKKRKGK